MAISIGIPREDFKDKIVLNVNAGIGMLSMMASTAGAAKVYELIQVLSGPICKLLSSKSAIRYKQNQQRSNNTQTPRGRIRKRHS
jgi:hypothetical protein